MEPGDPRRTTLLAHARERYAAGDLEAAWSACSEVAQQCRAAGDVDLLVETAMVFRRPVLVHGLRRHVNALAREVLLLRRGSAEEPDLRALVRATDDPFLDVDRSRSGPPDVTHPERRFLELQAAIAERQQASEGAARFALASEVVDLGRATGDAEHEAWGLRWRMDASGDLGLRLELTDDLASLATLADRLVGGWPAYVSLVRGSQALLEGDVAACLDLVRPLRTSGGETGFFALCQEYAAAATTGAGMEELLPAVRVEVSRLPFVGRVWLCSALLAAGRRDEAEGVWRAVAPHVHRAPPRAPEWLVVGVDAATLAVDLGDRPTAEALYTELQDREDLHVVGSVAAPYGGPVSLALGRLAGLLGRTDAAHRHLEDALERSRALHALPHVARAHADLALLLGPQTSQGAAHAVAAARLARRLGMAPLVARLLPEQGSEQDQRLSAREREVAAWVEQGLSNAAVARRLTLSERTVENHVSRALHKLGLRSRVDLALWSRDHPGGGMDGQ